MKVTINGTIQDMSLETIADRKILQKKLTEWFETSLIELSQMVEDKKISWGNSKIVFNELVKHNNIIVKRINNLHD